MPLARFALASLVLLAAAPAAAGVMVTKNEFVDTAPFFEWKLEFDFSGDNKPGAQDTIFALNTEKDANGKFVDTQFWKVAAILCDDINPSIPVKLAFGDFDNSQLDTDINDMKISGVHCIGPHMDAGSRDLNPAENFELLVLNFQLLDATAALLDKEFVRHPNQESAHRDRVQAFGSRVGGIVKLTIDGRHQGLSAPEPAAAGVLGLGLFAVAAARTGRSKALRQSR